MLEKLAGIEARYEELNRLMAEGTSGDYAKITEYAKERSDLEEIVNAYRLYRTVMSNLEGARALRNDPAFAELADEEIGPLERRQAELEERLKQLLVPKDPRDDKNVILEVRAGAGGDGAA